MTVQPITLELERNEWRQIADVIDVMMNQKFETLKTKVLKVSKLKSRSSIISGTYDIIMLVNSYNRLDTCKKRIHAMAR